MCRYSGGSDDEGQDVGDRGDGDGDSAVFEHQADAFVEGQPFLRGAEALVAGHYDEHVVDACGFQLVSDSVFVDVPGDYPIP